MSESRDPSTSHGARINRTLSKALIRLAPPELEFTEISIGTLPLYNSDFDNDFPAAGPSPAP